MENFLDLDDELRRLEGGGSGPWDGKRAAALVNRITHLDSVRPESDRDSIASEAAFYWKRHVSNALRNWENFESNWQSSGGDADSLPHVGSLQETIKQVEEHSRRAGIICDLFGEAIRDYQPPPSRG